MDRRAVLYALGVTALVALGGLLWLVENPPPEQNHEVPLRLIPLAGGAEHASAEISAMAWAGDQLVLVPQYPGLLEGLASGTAFVIARAQLEAFVEGRAEAVEVTHAQVVATGMESAIEGFDGFEAIVFDGDEVFATIEARRDDAATVGWLLRGRVERDADGGLAAVIFDPERRARLPAQNDLVNTGYEALVLQGDRLLAIYETNGDVNEAPRVLAFDRELRPVGELDLDALEYRVTDATEVDARGRFWVTNYHWPGAPWQPGVCQLTERYGEGASHARCRTVERLVELRITDDRVTLTRTPPILFELLDDEHARNWEGAVRFGDGFLVVTDEHPASILAYVPPPGDGVEPPP